MKILKKSAYIFLSAAMMASSVPCLSVQASQNIAKEIYVSPTGSDANDGSENAPFQTIERAKEEVRKINSNMQGDIAVYLREGTYILDDTLVFDEKDSGSNGYYVKYTAYKNEDVTISGGDKITDWKKGENGLWYAENLPYNYVRQLYVNDNRAKRAQSEKMVKIQSLYDDTTDDKYTLDGLITEEGKYAEYENQGDIQLHFGRGWQSWIFNVIDIEKTDDGKALFNMRQPMFASTKGGNHHMVEGAEFFVENAMEELDTPGEFYYNRQEKTLYYLPGEGEDMTKADVYAAQLDCLMKLWGEKSVNKVKNIEFNGLTFAHASWEDSAEFGQRNGQAQSLSYTAGMDFEDLPTNTVPSNIRMQWAEKIVFENNSFKDMGAVCLGFYQGVNYCRIEGNTFEDIADSAITVGSANQVYEDDVYEGYDLAADKPCSSSHEDSSYPSSNLFDTNKDSIWAQGSGTGKVWVMVDLLKPYRIDRVDIVARQNMDQATSRKNFEIQASNDPEFKKYVVLGRHSGEPFPHKGTYSIFSDVEDEYRYVRIQKTDGQYFCFADMRVINEDMPYSPSREVCRYNKIRNNYITRCGYANWGAPGIQSYYTQGLDISHNEIYNVAYTGIAIGWGWTSYPNSTVCRDNSVCYNRVHKNNMINFDGGGFYSLGQMPNTLVKGNYMSDQPNYIAGLYSDNGTKYHMLTENVVENVNQAYFINNGTGYITYKNNFSTATGAVMQNNNTSAEGTKMYTPGQAPVEALKIMNNAGIEKDWEFIKDRVGEDMWPVTPDVTYANIKNDFIEEGKFISNYLKNFLMNARIWVKKADIGNNIGQYPQSAVDEFSAFVESAIEIANTKGVTRDKIIETRLEFENALDKFKASRITKSQDELIAYAESELSSLKVGDGVGNVTQKTYDKLSEIITMAKDKKSDVMCMMLEQGVKETEAEKINLNVTGFSIKENLQSAVIDNENAVITQLVRYSADLSKVVPTLFETNDAVNISPSPSLPQNFNNPVYYTVSTKDGSASKTYKVELKKPEPFSYNGEYSLKEAIDDTENWNTIAGERDKIYKNRLFGDISLKFKANIETFAAGDWPSIVFRNQSPELSFGDKNNACYIIVFGEGKIEFHRFNDGVRTQFYGEVADVEQLLGPKISSDAFKAGKDNDIVITTQNTDEGVRIILNINGNEVFNVLDNYPGAITAPGYFGTVSPKAKVQLSAE